jgi:hypothetical protein
MIDGQAVIAALRRTDARSGGRREAWTESVSHARAEDTREPDLLSALDALDRLVSRLLLAG